MTPSNMEYSPPQPPAYTSKMSYIILNRFIFWIFIYLFGYFALDIKVCLFFASAWFIYTVTIKTTPNKKYDPLLTPSSEFRFSNLKRHHLPAWVLHPDTERSEWINSIIKQLWPHFDAYLGNMLSQLEKDPQLKENLASFRVNSLSFPSFNLGQIPPRITGIKVHSSVHRKEIIMDINLVYAGDMEISAIFGISTPLKKTLYLKGGLKDLTLKSCLRVNLSPLLRDKPFVGNVGLCFLDRPDIDFVLNGVVKFLDFPGIEVVLKQFLHDEIEKYFVNPNSFKIALQPHTTSSRTFSSSKSLEEGETHSIRLPSGVLTIKILEAKGLENKDMNLIGNFNKSDPYATLEIIADSSSHNYKTHVIQNNLHPNWNYTADLIVDDPESLDKIMINVWDKDSSNKDDFLGKCELSLQVVKTAITTGVSQEIWEILEGVQRGSVHAIISWSDLTMSFHPLKISQELQFDTSSSVGVLVMEIDSCSNLLGGRTGLKLPNPKVTVELCGVIQETEVIVGSIHPVFEHRLLFLVTNPKVDSLKISVLDTKRSSKEKCFGSLRLNVSDFLGKEDLSMLNQQFNLKSKTLKPGMESPNIIISAVFRYIDKTNDQASHEKSQKSLQDLHKSMTSSASKIEVLHNKPIPSAPSIPPIVLSSPKSPRQSIEDINNNESSEEQVCGSYLLKDHLKTPVSIPDLISVSQKYNLHLPTPPSPGKLSRSSKFPDYRAKLRLSIKYNSKTKTLSVVVHQGKNFPVFPNSNIGVKLYLLEELPQRLVRRLKNGKRKTKHHKTPEPNFEETLEYFLSENDLLTRKLEVVVEIHKGLRSKSLGEFIVDLLPLTTNSTLTKWYTLQLNERFEQIHSSFAGIKLRFSPTHSLKFFKMSE
ncbi:extended synaptotagmin-2 [Lepeophtheirus salmonis]|uniref:extended synaptotagmin-2 n=1 Tax=Lepeophtheirus salmonis TaxID=72036 RepID=UPI001AE26C0D|nr:extended synaptotagmin-1-like [Lepeophtheirus salmonis]XP_040575648.1 extended synaptotagmin-1-like [Lepeophtheirus salmonis]